MDLVRSALEPGNLLVLMIVIGALAQFMPIRRFARWLVSMAAIVVLIIGVSPLPALLVTLLENRFPSAQHHNSQIDGIIVLGGAIRRNLSQNRATPTIAEAGERLFAMIELMRRYPSKKVIYCGGDESASVK